MSFRPIVNCEIRSLLTLLAPCEDDQGLDERSGPKMTMSTGFGRVGRVGQFVRIEAHWVDQDRDERTEAFSFKCIDNQIYSNANKEISLYKRMRCFRFESVSRTDDSWLPISC
jgi:hypothetical protein